MGNRGYFLKTVLAMAIGLGLSTQAMAGNNGSFSFPIGSGWLSIKIAFITRR